MQVFINKKPVLPVYLGKPTDDLLKPKSKDCLIKYTGNGAGVKNQPKIAGRNNFAAFMVLYLTLSQDEQMVIFIKPMGKIATLEITGGKPNNWEILANSSDIDNLQEQINNLKSKKGMITFMANENENI